MATTDDSPTFIDTNVLVYFHAKEAPLHGAARRRLNELKSAGTPCWISRQVLREFVATLTRPQAFPAQLPIDAVLERAEHFESRFQVAEDGPATTRRLHQLIRQFDVRGKQIHDANIVATVLSHDIPRLLTHNTVDFQRFSELITLAGLQDKD